MKVLLFSNDLMPFGKLPTSGGGLRCWQLLQGLESRGIEVFSSMPGFTYLAEKHAKDIPEPQRELLWRWETQDEIYRRIKPDAVLFASNWDHFNLSGDIDVPVIIDLHGSRLIETTMWNEPVSTDRKVSILAKADCLLTAGTRQRSYFYGWLLQAGRVPKDEHFIRYIPISLSPERFSRRAPKNPDRAPIFVSGGGWFPWQNQAKAIFAACRRIADTNRGSIEIFGTPHETQNLSAEERIIRETYQHIRELSDSSERINVNGYVGRNELLDIYASADVALECMRYNLERELAFTTRTIEYLWCGLPVLYNDYSEISEHIKEYDAGWAVDPDNDATIERVLDEIFSSPEALARKSENAQRLVNDRFTWDKTIQPLVDFLENPSKAEKVSPVLGTAGVRASFLSPKGATADVLLGEQSVSQRFVIPAENIKTLEIPVSTNGKKAGKAAASVELEIRKASGALISRKRFSLDTLVDGGRLQIDFPWYARPKGGEEYRLDIHAPGVDAKQSGSGQDLIVATRGLLEARYPFLSQANSAVPGITLLGHRVKVQALAVSFVPGTGRLYRLRSIAQRVIWMIREGNWLRLWKAAVRRIPTIIHRVRHAVSN